MNYHMAQKMFQMVPYYALPWLHTLIKDDLPAPCPNIWAAFTELVPAILRQRQEKAYYLRKDLLATGRPYRKEFHCEVPDRSSIEA